MRKITIWVLLSLCLLFGVGTLVLPHFLSKALESHLGMKSGKTSVGLFGSISLKSIQGEVSLDSSTQMVYEVDQVQVDFSWVDLIFKKTVRQIMLEAPRVKIVEGDHPRFKITPQGDSSPSLMILRNLEIRRASFSYNHEGQYGSAILHVDEILSSIHVENENGSEKLKISGRLSGVVDDSGKVSISATVWPGQKEVRDQVSIQIENHDLSRTGGFFINEIGAKISGKLDLVRAELQLNRSVLQGTLDLRYHDLDIDILNDQRRLGISAFFQQAVIDVTTEKNSKKVSRGKGGSQVPVSAKRIGNGSIFNFMLSGLIPALQKGIQSR